MLKIGLISYNTNHLKSEEVFNNIVSKKYELTVFLLPFKARKIRDVLFKHRPDQSKAQNLGLIATKNNIKVIYCKNDLDIYTGLDYYLILGAGIISKECIKGKKIINCHPGIIPSVRGLDSFKFSILNNIRLGITLHYIDENVDEGELISTFQTPVYKNDTLKTLAKRHYENEIRILSNFEEFINNNQFLKETFEKLPATRRMSKETEEMMLLRVKEYIENFS